MHTSSSGIQRRTLLRAACAAGLAASTGSTWASARFPNKPVQLVLPFPPGGSFDPIFRTLATAASKELGQPVVLMHQPGAGGVMGTANVAQMNRADGYTVAVMHNSVIRAPLVQRVKWDPLKDLTYVCRLFDMITGVVVAQDAPWQNLRELMADAKKKPGQLSWGNIGALSSNRITAERLARSQGTSFNMVTFKGASEAFQSLIGKHYDVYGDPGFGSQVEGGRVRLLALFTDKRMDKYASVPTVKEQGFDFSIDSPVGLVAPKGLDAALRQDLEQAFLIAAKDAAYQNQLQMFDMVPSVDSGANYEKYAQAQWLRDQRMLDEIGFKLD